MSQRLTSKPETGTFPSDGGASASEIALKIAGDKGGPAIVLFVNDSPRQDPRTPEGKASLLPVRDTLSMRPCLLDPRIEDFTMALRLFRIITVDVQGVEPSACPVVNKYKCPVVAVIGFDKDGKDRKVIKTFGPGISTKTQIQEAMTAGLKPRFNLESYLEKERKIVKEYVKYDAFAADLDTKRKLLAEADGPNAGKGLKATMEEQVQRREEELSKMDASLRTQEMAVDAELSSAGLSRT